MKKWSQTIGFGFFYCALVAHAEIQITSNVLVQLDPQSITGIADNTVLTSLANQGSLGGTFVSAAASSTAKFQTNVAGAKAFVFDGTSASVMTNTVLPPASICGSNVWSLEVWVHNPQAQASAEDVFTWTKRENWPAGNPNLSCMEFRYGSDAGNAIEHYGSGNNLTWGGSIPSTGAWHYVVCTRDSSGVERLYVDTRLVTSLTLGGLRLRADGFFTLAGVYTDTTKTFANFFSGSVGALRIHSGTLSQSQIARNYSMERSVYGLTAISDIAVWSGVAGQFLPWNDVNNWLDGVVGSTNYVNLDNGGIPVVTNAFTGTMKGLMAAKGGLIFTNDAFMAFNFPPYFGIGPTNSFNLVIAEGWMNVKNSFYLGNNSPSTLTIGGTEKPAMLTVSSELFLGDQANAPLSQTFIRKNGQLIHSNAWFRVGRLAGGQSVVTVEEGGYVVHVAGSGVTLGSQGAEGTLVMNGGLFEVRNNFIMMSEWTVGKATIQLNGGRLLTPYISDNGATQSTIFFNGGCLAPWGSAGVSDFIRNVKRLYVQPGGAVIDTAATTMTISRSMVDDPAYAGVAGGFKKLGSGSLYLSASNAFSGPITVTEGQLHFTATNGLPTTYAGAILLTSNGLIAARQVGGATLLAQQMQASSVGRIGLYAINTNDAVNLTSLPNVTLEYLESGSFNAAVIPYNNRYVFRPMGTSVTYGGAIADVPGYPASITLPTNTPAAGRLVLAQANALTGPVMIEGGILEIRHGDALGTSAAGQNITLRNFAALKLNAENIPADFVATRITPDSQGVLLLGPACTNQTLDLSGYPGLYVGSDEVTLNYTGALTPEGTTYRLGGGLLTATTNATGLNIASLQDDGSTPRRVVIGQPGVVYLKAGNTYSGGTRIESNGVAYVAADGGFGAVPASVDVQNIVLDGGFLRSTNSLNTLSVNRGIQVSGSGGRLHVYSGCRLLVQGPLSGTGTVSIADVGTVQLGSTNNTFNGPVSVNPTSGSTTFEIGTGSLYSWTSVQPITGSNQGGVVAINANAAVTFASKLDGALTVIKRGTGTTTLSVGGNTYTGTTRVEAGLLQVAATDVIPYGVGKGVVELYAAGAFDLNGRDVRINGVQGEGLVTNTLGSAQTLRVGETNIFAFYSGKIASSVTVRKVNAGASYQLDCGADLRVNPAVDSGVLALQNVSRLQTPITVAAGAQASLRAAANGLMAEFIDYTPVNTAGVDTNLLTAASVNALFAQYTPTISTNSVHLGLAFDYGAMTTCKFPGKYANGSTERFAARWRGRFYAPVDGTYTFGLSSDDCSMLFINDAVVVSNNVFQGYQSGAPQRSGSVALTAGFYPILIAFCELTGDQGLTAYVTIPGCQRTLLPQALLDYAVNDAETTAANTLSGATVNGAGVAEKAGCPALTLVSDNSAFAGSWIVRNGILRVGNGGASGTLGGTAVSLTNSDSCLAVNRSDSVTLSQAIGGVGSVNQEGAGTTTLTGANTYSGSTTISQGVLRVVSPGRLGSGALTNNGALVFELDQQYAKSQVAPYSSVVGSGTIDVKSGSLVLDQDVSGGYQVSGTGATYLTATNINAVTLAGGTLGFGSGAARVSMGDVSNWQLNGTSSWQVVGESINLTPGVGSVAGSVIYKTPVPINTPWEISFTYRVADTSAVPADGFAVFIHRAAAGATALGATGGGKGYTGSISPSYGFAINTYTSANPKYDFAWCSNGAEIVSSKLLGMNGIVTVDTGTYGPIYVSMAFDGVNKLYARLIQGNKVFTTNCIANISNVLSNATGYIGISGGTGGSYMRQNISDLRIKPGTTTISNVTYATTLVAASNTSSRVVVDFGQTGLVTTANGLTLQSGSAVTVGPVAGAPTNMHFTVAVNSVSVEGASHITVTTNGSGLGKLAFSRLVVDVTSYLTIVGAVEIPNNTLTIVTPPDFRRGTYLIADLTAATGIDATTTFVVEGPQDATVFYRAGKLYLSRPNGSIVILR